MVKSKDCKTCAFADQCERVWKNPNVAYVGCVSWTPVVTNGDRIRDMTDEELAEFFFRFDRLYMMTPQETIIWLKQEA